MGVPPPLVHMVAFPCHLVLGATALEIRRLQVPLEGVQCRWRGYKNLFLT